MDSPHPAPDDGSSFSEGPLSVLLIEGNPDDARLFEEYLEESSPAFALRHELTLEAGMEALRREKPDVLAVDLGLPDSEGPETVEIVTGAAPEVPIVVLAGQGDLEAALQAQEAGVAEYVRKDELTPALAGRTLQWAAQRSRMQAKLRQRDAWIRSITESISAGVFRVGPTGRIEYANRALADMLGVDTEEELIGRDLTGFYADPMDRGRMLVEEGAVGMEVKLEGEGGEERIGLLSAKPAYDGDGKTLHYDGTITDITGRAKREETLRMLSEAVEQANESVLITEAGPLDEPGPRVEYVNAAYEEMTGYSREEMKGKTPRVLQGPETDREVLDSLREALEAGEEWQGETVNYRKDGEPYRVQWNVAPVRNGNGSGEIEHWVSVQRDVTEERRREEEVQRQNSLLEQAQRLAGAWETDLRSGEAFWSEKAYEIHDLDSSAELRLEQAFEFLAPEARPRAREAFRRCAEEGTPYDLELPMVTATGRRRWVRTVGGPAETDGDQVLKVAGALQDITDRKRYEQELEHYREYTDDILDAVDDVFYILGPEGKLERWNRSLLKVTGYGEEEVAQMHGTDFFAGEHADTIADAIADVFETGDVIVEAPFHTKGGAEVPYEFVATLVEAPDGEEKLVGIGRDITERKRRERGLERRQEKLEALYEAANRLLAASGKEEVADQLIDLVRETLGYPGVSVRFARAGQLVPARVSPETMEFMPERPVFEIEGKSAVAEVYRTGETQAVEDLRKVQVEDPHDYGDLRAVVVVPIGAHGTFAVASPEPGAISGFDTHLIEVLGTYGAAVLDGIDQEEELRGTKNFYEQVLRQLPIDLAVFSPDAKFEYVNPQGISDPDRREQVLGRTNEEYLRERGFDPEVGRRRDEAIREAARKERTIELEETLDSEDGPRHYLRVHGPVIGTDGAVTHVAGFGLDITEQKERRKRLEEQREYTSRLLNASEDLFFVVGPNGTLQRWNDQVASVTGYAEEELRGKDVLGFFPEEEKEAAAEAVSEVFETGSAKIDTFLLTKGGRQVAYEFTGNLARHPGGDLRLVGIGRDITERKRREEKLRRRDRRLEEIRKNITDVVWMSPADKSDIEFLSTAYEDIWGRTTEEVREDPSSIVEAIHPDDRERVRSAIEVQKEVPEEYEETYRVVQPGGEVRWVRDRASGVYDEDGRLTRIIGVATDITEKRRREEALRDRRRKAEALYEATRFLLSAESSRAVSRRVHEVVEEVFGYDLSNTGFVEEGLIKPVDVAVGDSVEVPDLGPQSVEGESVAARALGEGETVVAEDPGTLGNEIDYGDLTAVAAVPIGGRGVVVLGQAGDREFDPFNLRLIEVLAGYGGAVLNRLENERELVKAKEEAEEGSRLKTALLANMSHEIRTPLTSIIGFAELLKEEASGDAADFAERIRQGGERLMKTLDSMLELSRLEAGSESLSREAMSLNEVVEETIGILRPSAEKKSISLEAALPEKTLRGVWNEGGLSRILENLIENAIKFTPEGGRVEVRARTDGEEVLLEVEDTGIGISEEAQEEIFQAFKQESEGMDREYEGTGLGLSIVRRLAEAHGGSVEADAEKGKGSCFSVRLPTRPEGTEEMS